MTEYRITKESIAEAKGVFRREYEVNNYRPGVWGCAPEAFNAALDALCVPVEERGGFTGMTASEQAKKDGEAFLLDRIKKLVEETLAVAMVDLELCVSLLASRFKEKR